MAARFPHANELLVAARLTDGVKECRRRLREDGCLLLRNVLDPDSIARARDDLTQRLRRQGAVAAAVDGPVWSGAPVSTIDPFALYDGEPVFEQVALSEPLRVALETLHGEPIHVYRSVQIRFALPDDEIHTIPTHQDARYITPDPQFLAFWVPLVDIAPGEGGLAVVPRSHDDGLYEHPLSHDYFSYYMGEERPQRCIPLDRVKRPWFTADFRAGDLLVFDSLTVHTGLPNRTRNVRLSIDGRYQPARNGLVNWQARYSVLEGTRRRQCILALLPDVDAIPADVREAVIAHMLCEDLPLDSGTAIETLDRCLRSLDRGGVGQ